METSVLELADVAKTHRAGPYEQPLLTGVTLSLGAGSVVAVWGSPRAGKTTLLRLAAGLDVPDEGVVRLDGADLATLSQKALGELRLRTVGLVSTAGPRTTELPILHYVALPLMRTHGRGGALGRARSMLGWVGAGSCADARWEHLSDSEKALVSVAHGLVREPRLLLVDDVTARLDALQQAEVLALVQRAAAEQDVAVLVTCSALSAAVGAHETFTLSQGRLKAVSEPASLGQLVRFPGRSRTADA